MIGETSRCWCRCELEKAESVAGAGSSLGNDNFCLTVACGAVLHFAKKDDLLCHGYYIMNIYSPYRDLGNEQTHPPKIILLIA